MRHFFFLIISLTFFWSCSSSKDENPIDSTPDDPIASFNYNGTTDTPATINFQNTSQNADSYVWDFGDGTASTMANPSKTFDTKGTYTVILTASNSTTGKSNESSQSITINPGKVFIQEVIVDGIPFTDSNGAGWDLSSGPDVFFTLIDSVGSVLVDGSSAVYDNTTPAMLPLTWQFNPELEILKSAWNKTYFVRIWDYDTTGDDLIGTTGGFKIVTEINANYPTTVSLQSSDGQTNVRLQLRWE